VISGIVLTSRVVSVSYYVLSGKLTALTSIAVSVSYYVISGAALTFKIIDSVSISVSSY